MKNNIYLMDNKQRPVISAMFSSPGPACVGRIKVPEGLKYSFGLKTNSNLDSGSPGPAAYRVQERSTRYGGDGTPKYSLSGRSKKWDSFNTPGPDAYHTENLKIFKQNTPPSYSFGSRTVYFKRNGTPGPNAYSVPQLFGSNSPTKTTSPAYSMRGRAYIGGFSQDLRKTPGPGTYKISDVNGWKNKAPSYSMGGRYMMSGDSTQKPGPSAYTPILSKSHDGFSFGIRHSEYIAPLIV